MHLKNDLKIIRLWWKVILKLPIKPEQMLTDISNREMLNSILSAANNKWVFVMKTIMTYYI